MTVRNVMRHAVREPLVHFLLAGLVICIVSSAFGGSVDAGDRRIIVNAAQVKRLATQWAMTWQRAPSPEELDGLIRDHIKEEIYYREALRLGLDKDDTIVRRRMRAKMEFLATSQAENIAPRDAELQAWLDKNPARYAADPVYGFEQVYVRSEGDSDVATARAQALLKQLQGGADPGTLGDTISLPRRLEGAAASDIDRQFGEDFSATLKPLPVGQWRGPVASGFGLHLVRVNAVTAGRTPSLSEVRRTVENDWRQATRSQREAKAYQALLDGYAVSIEKAE